LNTRASILSIIAATALSGALLAQTSETSFPLDPRGVSTAHVRTGIFTRTIAGNVDGRSTADLVALKGGTPYLLVDPINREATWEITGLGPVHDIASLRTAGNYDVLCVGEEGLFRLDLDTSTGHYTRTDLAGSAWEDALMVRVGQLDLAGSPEKDIFGVDQSATAVLVCLESGGQFVPSASVVPGGTISDLVAWNRNGLDADELAVVTDVGLRLYTYSALNGPTQIHESSFLGGGYVETLEHETKSELAVVYPADPDLPQTLRVERRDGSCAEIPLTYDIVGDLEPAEVVGIDSGDVDLDGLADIVLSVRNGFASVLLIGQPDPQDPLRAVYSLDEEEVDHFYISWTPESGSPESNCAIPLLYDLDGDEDLECIQPIQGDETVHYGINYTVQNWLMPEVASFEMTPLEGDWHEAKVVLDVDHAPTDAYAVEFTVWKEENGPGGRVVVTQVGTAEVRNLGARFDPEFQADIKWDHYFEFRYLATGRDYASKVLPFEPDHDGPVVGPIGDPGTILPDPEDELTEPSTP